MDRTTFPDNRNPYLHLNIKDIFSLIIFFLIPFSFFATNFVSYFKLYYYAILAVFIAIYTLVGQFFFESTRLGNLGKKLLSLTVINTLVIPFIHFTGNISSPYFFIIYFLIFSVAIFSSFQTILFECIVIFASIFVAEIYSFQIFNFTTIKNIDPIPLARLVSIILAVPLGYAISSYIYNLQKKQELFELSKQLLAIRDIEDEALLEELDQGIIIIDSDLKIVKISKWIENNFSLAAKLLLGKHFNELDFYDPVSDKKMSKEDYFYKNLQDKNPKELNWRVLYKNQYGKFKKFIIKQTPLIVDAVPIGFLLSVKFPPKNISDLVSSFNQVLNFRLSSNLAMIQNIINVSEPIKSDPSCKTVSSHIENMIYILNDASIKSQIADGNYEISISKFDLKKLVQKVTSELQTDKKTAIWNISPYFKNKPFQLSTDLNLLEKLLSYSLRAAHFLSDNSEVNLTFDEDENLMKPRIVITSKLRIKFSDNKSLIDPFFGGNLEILSHYKGSGLELSNANLIANYLGFDFNAQISNNKLVIKIIF